MLHFWAWVHNCFPLIISPFRTRCILVNDTVISQVTPAFVRSLPNDSALPHFLLNKMNISHDLSKACFYFHSFIFVLSVMGLRVLSFFKSLWILCSCCQPEMLQYYSCPLCPALCSAACTTRPQQWTGPYWEELDSPTLANFQPLGLIATCCGF